MFQIIKFNYNNYYEIINKITTLHYKMDNIMLFLMIYIFFKNLILKIL